MVPSALIAEYSYSPKAAPVRVTPSRSPLNVFRRAVPAIDPLTPLLAIRPMATATSSMLYPRAPATDADILNVSPMIATLVLELVAAAASTSEKWAVSFAVRPNALRLSVTMSDTIARSSPDAAASCNTPSMPCNISVASHPAIAMYPMASALSLAVNLVVAPSSLASADNAAISSALAWDSAFTVDIASSKLPAPSTQSMNASLISPRTSTICEVIADCAMASNAWVARAPKLAALSAALFCSDCSSLILAVSSASF